MGVVCIGWWALHTADSIMLSDALLQLRVLMLKKRGGREEGGGGSRDANAMFDLCQMHLCQYTCQNAQLFSQTLLVNINEGQALSKWIVTIPSLANSWKPLKTFASAAKTPGPAPAIVGVLGTAPHISLKQLWLIWPSEKPKPSKDMICLLSSLYFLKIFIVIANLIVISGVSVSIEWQSDLSSHIFSPKDPTLERRFRLHHCNCYCHHQSHHKLFSGLFNHQILAGLLLLCHQDQSAFHPNSTEMSKGRKVLCVLCPVCSPFPHHQCLMPRAPGSHFPIWSDAWPVSLILFLVSFLQPLFLTNPSLHLCSMDFYWCLVSSEYLCPPFASVATVLALCTKPHDHWAHGCPDTP